MTRIGAVTTLGLLLVFSGCGKKPLATVEFSYTMQPKEPLPERYMSIAVRNADVSGDTGEFDQRKWCEMTADLIQYYLQQAAEKYDIPLKLVDREHLKIALDEKDLADADITDTSDEIASAQIEGVTANLTSRIIVKIDKQKATGRTVSGLGGFASRWGGGGSVSTDEVERERRSITVTCQFQLKDAADNSAIAAHSGKPRQYHERTKTSPFFGGSKTEADMAPRDKVIGEIIEEELQKFLVKFVPTEIHAVCEVKASSHEMSVEAVRAMVIDDYETALAHFKQVIAEDRDDDKSLFGAGVCCEKLEKFDEALKYYKQAKSLKPKEEQYDDAIDRVSSMAAD
ncbi:MAG: tetratricopeptide repeat protein [Phycisphaerae bacterium]|nr:tetratricopeptide repeat protein [Phycisphaerae bacterium]